MFGRGGGDDIGEGVGALWFPPVEKTRYDDDRNENNDSFAGS